MRFRILLTCILSLIVLLNSYQDLSMYKPSPAAIRTTRPVVIAHRGLSSQAPENTLAAFEQAYSIGADFLEFDVHLSADGAPVVIHDPTLERTTDSKEPLEVTSLTTSELARFDAGAWFSEQFRGESIPLLTQVLEKYVGKVGLFIELKELKGDESLLVEAVLKALSNSPINPERPVILGSFSPTMIATVLAHSPNQPVLGIADDLEAVRQHLNNGVKHIALNCNTLSQKIILDLHQKGIAIWSFTVDDPQRARELIDAGLDGIITNLADKYVSPIDHRTI